MKILALTQEPLSRVQRTVNPLKKAEHLQCEAGGAKTLHKCRKVGVIATIMQLLSVEPRSPHTLIFITCL